MGYWGRAEDSVPCVKTDGSEGSVYLNQIHEQDTGQIVQQQQLSLAGPTFLDCRTMDSGSECTLYHLLAMAVAL